MSKVNDDNLSLKYRNAKTIHFLKKANSFVLKEDFEPGQTVTLPKKIADYFIANKIADEVSIDTEIPTKKFERYEIKYISHPLIKKNVIESRLYQEIAFAETVKKNSLVILPTGLGKTVIAVLSSVYWLNKDNNHKVMMFAPTRPLLDQHYRTFKEWLDLSDFEIVQITGRTYKKKRGAIFDDARIIFMTPQVNLNDFSLEDVILMIFDECHRAVKKYRYTYNARIYFNEAKNPHVLGLTATPGTPQKLLNIMRNLQIEKVALANEETSIVKPYVYKIYEQYVKIALPDEIMELRNFIDTTLKKKLIILKNHPLVKKYTRENYKINPHELIRIVGMQMGSMGSLKPILMQILSLTYLLNLVEAQSLEAFENKLMTISNSRNPVYAKLNVLLQKIKAQGIKHPKPKIATNIIKKFCEKNENSRVLVFVQYLDSLEIILEHLKDKKIKVDKLVGQKIMTQDKQRIVLDKFKSGEFQVLAATSVAEEGLDIAQCDLVVFYDCIPSGIRTIQRRGRTGRRRDGRLVYLYTAGTWEESFIYISRKRIRETNQIIKMMEKQNKPLEFLRNYLKKGEKFHQTQNI
ncbi:MAG: helicase-related protein [Candidatus Helarchaeota archaeon]